MGAFSKDQIRREAIADMTAEIRTINIEKGWRPTGGGPGDNSFGDYAALLVEEIGEMVSAYRKHRLADATRPVCGRAAGGEEPCPEHGPSKPEGVGSEMADLLIRLIDMADVFAINLEAEYDRKVKFNRTRDVHHGGTMADPKPAVRDTRPGSVPDTTMRFNMLWMALPNDPRGWWTAEEADAFVDVWQGLEMPHASMIDVTGDRVTLWCVDVKRAAALVDMADAMVGEGFEICKGEYSVGVVQAGKRGRS